MSWQKVNENKTVKISMVPLGSKRRESCSKKESILHTKSASWVLNEVRETAGRLAISLPTRYWYRGNHQWISDTIKQKNEDICVMSRRNGKLSSQNLSPELALKRALKKDFTRSVVGP